MGIREGGDWATMGGWVETHLELVELPSSSLLVMLVFFKGDSNKIRDIYPHIDIDGDKQNILW